MACLSAAVLLNLGGVAALAIAPPSPPAGSKKLSRRSSSLSSGAAAGVAIGAVLGSVLVLGIVTIWYIRRRRQRQLAADEADRVRKARQQEKIHRRDVVGFSGGSPAPSSIWGFDSGAPPTRSLKHPPAVARSRSHSNLEKQESSLPSSTETSPDLGNKDSPRQDSGIGVDQNSRIRRSGSTSYRTDLDGEKTFSSFSALESRNSVRTKLSELTEPLRSPQSEISTTRYSFEHNSVISPVSPHLQTVLNRRLSERIADQVSRIEMLGLGDNRPEVARAPTDYRQHEPIDRARNTPSPVSRSGSTRRWSEQEREQIERIEFLQSPVSRPTSPRDHLTNTYNSLEYEESTLPQPQTVLVKEYLELQGRQNAPEVATHGTSHSRHNSLHSQDSTRRPSSPQRRLSELEGDLVSRVELDGTPIEPVELPGEEMRHELP